MSARTPSARTPSVRTPSASSLSVEQRAAQTFAVYRTGSPTSFGNGWPGCVGAVKQPTGASPRDARRLRNSIQRTVMAACGRADSSSSAGGDDGIPALFFQEALQNSPVANLKKEFAKRQAGEYDEAATRARLEALIRDTPCVMFSFST